VASEIAIGTIDDHYRRTEEDNARRWPFRLTQPQVERDRMTTAIKLANARIYRAGMEDPEKKGMGCTVDAVYFTQGRVYIGHVGDSRVYRVRDGHITQVTEDHSLLNDYRRMKEMSGEDLENFPHKNVVVRALGLAEYVAVDIVVDEYDLGDIYLLCSDGLSGMLSDDAMLELVQADESLDGVCSALVREANEAGGVDNISVVLARVEHQ
jgi:protein phosphatase